MLILEMREGKIIAQKHFTIHLPFEMDKSEILSSFIQQYYSQKERIVNKIITKELLSDEKLLNDWLGFKGKNEKQEKTIIRPRNQEEKELMNLANENAEMKLQSKVKIAQIKEKKADELLEQLAKTLELEKKPVRIEGYDISTLQGTNTVASCVVFEKAKPKKSDYRRFSIRTIDYQDDFASIREVIKRRFTGSLVKEQKPDLILIDGGAGQVSSAATILRELEIDIPLIGLAKEFEEIYFSDKRKPLRLEKRAKTLQLLQQIRDEAHRFAITYHRTKRAKKMLNSSLEKIPGLGKKKIELLFKRFLTIKSIREATIEELIKVKGINTELALKIIDYFKSEETTY
jgi:excinuclease ABC subunit C